MKKIEIYRTPEYLILHLKRFSHSAGRIFGGARKLKTEIDFQIKGLDRTPYLVELKNKKKE